MKTETFGELLGSMKEALEHAEGKRNLRTTTIPLPPAPLDGRAVKRARAALHASQAVFARYLNVSTKLVQAWEAGRRVPDGPALVLLHIAADQPELIEVIRHQAQGAKRRSTKATGRNRGRRTSVARRQTVAAARG
jgi:putative transcriptional regulator